MQHHLSLLISLSYSSLLIEGNYNRTADSDENEGGGFSFVTFLAILGVIGGCIGIYWVFLKCCDDCKCEVIDRRDATTSDVHRNPAPARDAGISIGFSRDEGELVQSDLGGETSQPPSILRSPTVPRSANSANRTVTMQRTITVIESSGEYRTRTVTHPAMLQPLPEQPAITSSLPEQPVIASSLPQQPEMTSSLPEQPVITSSLVNGEAPPPSYAELFQEAPPPSYFGEINR